MNFNHKYEEILEFLKKHPSEWFSARDIAEALNYPRHKLNDNLRSMRKHRSVLFKSFKSPQNGKPEYRYMHDEQWWTNLKSSLC